MTSIGHKDPPRNVERSKSINDAGRFLWSADRDKTETANTLVIEPSPASPMLFPALKELELARTTVEILKT